MPDLTVTPWEQTVWQIAVNRSKKTQRLGFQAWSGVRNPNPEPIPGPARLRGARAGGLATTVLGDDQVREIRRSLLPLATLSDEYGVSKAQVSRVRNRKRRAEVPDLP